LRDTEEEVEEGIQRENTVEGTYIREKIYRD
jgi:hypothetical protein